MFAARTFWHLMSAVGTSLRSRHRNILVANEQERVMVGIRAECVGRDWPKADMPSAGLCHHDRRCDHSTCAGSVGT